MSISKRLMDVMLSSLLIVVLSPVALVIAGVIKLSDGGDVFYIAERMRAVNVPFQFWKFRTMKQDEVEAVLSGGHTAGRVTRVGRFLRRTRLDELPQLINILRGDISFVGPRPPLRRYVEMCPDVYSEVLKTRPGVTGLATLAIIAARRLCLRPVKRPKRQRQSMCVPASQRRRGLI